MKNRGNSSSAYKTNENSFNISELCDDLETMTYGKNNKRIASLDTDNTQTVESITYNGETYINIKDIQNYVNKNGSLFTKNKNIDIKSRILNSNILSVGLLILLLILIVYLILI